MLTLLQTNDQLVQTWIVYIILGIISWVIFYYIVKTAVKNGIIAARKDPEGTAVSDKKAQYTTDQVKLQKQYENKEVTYEEYQAAWDKLEAAKQSS